MTEEEEVNAYNGSNNNVINMWNSFADKASRFAELTDELMHEGVNPGGHYKAIWARDASYILKDWFLSGMFDDVMREILFIWSHQIVPDGEKIVYGRGSPEMKYLSQIAPRKVQKQFEGALPTTIFRGFSEVYGRQPDIDSTALMVSTTSWILDAYIKSGLVSANSAASSYPSSSPLGNNNTGLQELKISSIVSNPQTVIEFVVPRMLKAVDYLATRDIDGDGLLEQGHNEDWMDTVLRAGKIVYSQACWILALSNFSSLLSELGSADDAHKLLMLSQRTIHAVEQKLWLEEEGTYIDVQEEESPHTGKSYKTLTQDVSLYLTAVTENTIQDVLSNQTKTKTKQKATDKGEKETETEKEEGDEIQQEEKEHPQQNANSEFIKRGNSTLDAIRNRIWNKNNWPLVTEVELEKTGPWVLHPNQYHNHTFWAWTTGIEMLARSRFERIEECNTLLSILISPDSEQQYPRGLYEWVNPITDKGSGAFPFKTGISAVRIAIADIIFKKSSLSY